MGFQINECFWPFYDKGFIFEKIQRLDISFLDKIIFASVTLGTGFLTSFLLDKLNKIDEKSKKKAEEDQPTEIILKTLPHLKNLNKIYAPGTPDNSISKFIYFHQRIWAFENFEGN